MIRDTLKIQSRFWYLTTPFFFQRLERGSSKRHQIQVATGKWVLVLLPLSREIGTGYVFMTKKVFMNLYIFSHLPGDNLWFTNLGDLRMPMRCGVPVGTGFGDSNSIIKGFGSTHHVVAVGIHQWNLTWKSENKSLEKESPFWKPWFSGSMLNFGGVFFGIIFFFESTPFFCWTMSLDTALIHVEAVGLWTFTALGISIRPGIGRFLGKPLWCTQACQDVVFLMLSLNFSLCLVHKFKVFAKTVVSLEQILFF